MSSTTKTLLIGTATFVVAITMVGFRRDHQPPANGSSYGPAERG